MSKKHNTGLDFANHYREATAHYKVGYRLEQNSNTLNSAVKHKAVNTLTAFNY